MKRVLAILGLIISSIFCHYVMAFQSQGPPPDFTGTWLLDKSKTTATEANGRTNEGAVTLAITHKDPEIRVVQTGAFEGKLRAREFVYYSDGRGESNPPNEAYENHYNGQQLGGPQMPSTVESRSKWDKGNLKVQYSIIIQLPNGRVVKARAEEKWEISIDGQTLTRTTSYSASNPDMTISIRPSKKIKVFHRTS